MALGISIPGSPRSWDRPYHDLLGLRIDPADVVGAELQQIEVIFAIRWNAVGADISIFTGNFKLAEVLILAGGDIQPVDGMGILIVRPDFAVHMRIRRVYHGLLRVVSLPFFWDSVDLKFFGLSVELRDAPLVHQRDPQV